MVFQAFNLFPHLTVLENVMLFPVSVHHVPKDEAKKKALEILDRVGLADKANEYPRRLSGGQRSASQSRGLSRLNRSSCSLMNRLQRSIRSSSVRCFRP